MKRILYVIFLAGIAGLFCMGCNLNKKSIRLATYTYATNNRLENMKLLAQELENKLQRDVSTKSYPDVESFITGIKSNEVDIALINTLGYLALSSDNEHMLPIANMHIKEDAIDNYKTVFLTNNDSIKDDSDINKNAEKLTMMFVKEGSTSGNLVPRLFLSAINITEPESRFKEVKYGGNHTSTFQKLLNGEADFCAIGSNEYYKQIHADTTLKNKVKLLWVSDEIPLGPVLVNNALSSEEKDIISELLLNLHTENADAFESIKAGWSEAKQADKFQEISDEYYNSFREVNGNKTHLDNILKMLGI
ncbi:MAG: phosphate/phosphite/phosphonate ABC transporter substrate-binding protein [Winogradskyella sp.]|uniref:phosphate/phosphite/phosphonate ABC transporter substrate-binding protein n=1 Tax=Winogradskyella sp. TaxID=1883156 RepID=UPI000F3F2BAA|nr:PhnD/SsuA/transferrin family substrate-binding protein [Winogradskyella sp.]RNC87200.1 MAG: phosphate/phosphite/phosphonate ABC transporter substrate-binding protein [Winogradskyella sp.]